MIEVCERFRDHLLEAAKQCNELEMKDLCARFTTDVIGTCAFGIDCNSLNDPNAEFRYYGEKIFGTPRHSPVFNQLIQAFRGLSRKLHVKISADDVSNFFLKVVRETVEYRESNNISRNDFMDILIKLKNQNVTDADKAVTLNEISAQAFLFFLAGFGSLSTTLTFCLYELGKNPEIQSKARQIIRAALEKHNGQFTYEMMMDMPYIDQILHGKSFYIIMLIILCSLYSILFHSNLKSTETLRKYPSFAHLVRMAKKNYQIAGTNMVIEKGM